MGWSIFLASPGLGAPLLQGLLVLGSPTGFQQFWWKMSGCSNSPAFLSVQVAVLCLYFLTSDSEARPRGCRRQTYFN